jgi:hypothetical protein
MIVSAQYNRHTGLGNKLFPWSRAKIFANEKNIKMVSPLWFSPRGAAITRGGINYNNALRKIWLLRNFTSDEDEVQPFNYLLKYRAYKRMMVDHLPMARDYNGNECHIIFKWNSCHNYIDIYNKAEFILNTLFRIIPDKECKMIEKYSKESFIAMNVRCGNDFIEPYSNENGYRKTSLTWFKNSLQEVRRIYGDLPVLIVSDGGIKQLCPLLQIPNVKLVSTKTAIADLLILTKSSVLMASGNSSFSAWASFLGGMDTFSAKSTPFTNFHINSSSSTQKIEVL